MRKDASYPLAIFLITIEIEGILCLFRLLRFVGGAWGWLELLSSG